MNQTERRNYLIRELLSEQSEYASLQIPEDDGGQKSFCVLLHFYRSVSFSK